MNDHLTRTPGGRRGFSAAISNFAGNLKSPGGIGLPSFGGNSKSNKPSPGLASISDGGAGGGMSAIPNSGLGGLGGTGFQEPLPLPEMQEEEHSNRNRRVSMSHFAGKMKMSIKGIGFGKRKQTSPQDFGGMLDDDQDDEMQGGLLG
jgi:hypothetical protein